MVRLLAFALHADERLEFGRGLSDEDEPALWRRDYTGEIEQWIELGQPDESRIRKACGRAQQVSWSPTAATPPNVWWNKNAAALARLKQPHGDRSSTADSVDAATGLLARSMRLTAMIQDGELQLMDTQRTVALRPSVRMASTTVTPA